MAPEPLRLDQPIYTAERLGELFAPDTRATQLCYPVWIAR